MNTRAAVRSCLVGCLLVSAATGAQTASSAPAVLATPGAAAPPAAIVAPAAPQRAVATLRDVRGIVLVSRGDGMAAGTARQALPAGTRIVTTLGAEATINFGRGCTVRLQENQRFTVRDSNDCAALSAAVESTVLPATPSDAGTSFGGAASFVGLGIVAAAIHDLTRPNGRSARMAAAASRNNVSPE